MYVLCKHNTTCSIVYLYKYWDIKHEAYMLGVCPLLDPQESILQGSHCLFLSALYRRGFVDSVHYLGGN